MKDFNGDELRSGDLVVYINGDKELSLGVVLGEYDTEYLYVLDKEYINGLIVNIIEGDYRYNKERGQIYLNEVLVRIGYSVHCKAVYSTGVSYTMPEWML